MKDGVSHQGVIESIEGSHVRVRFTQHSACGACKIAGHCSASEAKVKVVDIYEADAAMLHIGDTVNVTTQMSMVNRALLLGVVLPLVLMIVTLIILKFLGVSDGITALAMLAVLVPYYLILWLCRGSIARAITFRIED